MDNESFLSCLSYIEATAGGNEIPIALGSVLLGFVLSFLATNLQSYRSKTRQMKLLREEVSFARDAAKRTFIGASILIDQLDRDINCDFMYQFALSHGFAIPQELYFQALLDLSEMQRQNLRNAIDGVDLISTSVSWVKSDANQTNRVMLIRTLVRLLDECSKCYVNCGNVLNDTNNTNLSIPRLAEMFDLDFKFFRDLGELQGFGD